MATRFDRESIASGPVIRGFSGRRFLVDDKVADGGVLLSPLWAREWPARDVAALTVADVEALLTLEPLPEFLLLGTGERLVRPAPAFARAVEARGLGLEVMDSRTAARAWGVLRAEERWIGAALLPL